MPIRKPVSEEQDHAGKQPRLGEAEQKTHGEKAPRADAECRRARQQAPCHHDPRDPNACADLFQDDVARDFEEKITPEEGAGRHAVSGGVQAQILVHRKRRETDIDAIEIAKKISKNRQR